MDQDKRVSADMEDVAVALDRVCGVMALAMDALDAELHQIGILGGVPARGCISRVRPGTYKFDRFEELGRRSVT